MIRYILILILILIVSCKPYTKVVLYKDKNIVDKAKITNSVKDFSWNWIEYKAIDSIVIKNSNAKKILDIIKNSEVIENKEYDFGSPRYALILNYNNKKDTLYLFDFNSDFYKNEGYFVQNNITFKDTDDKLRKFFLKKYNNFVRREYYSSDDNKEVLYYLKEEIK